MPRKTREPAILNIAGYRFARIPEQQLDQLRRSLKKLCLSRRLKGTILISREGINLFVAGDRAGIDALLRQIRQLAGFASFAVKESFSEDQPFRRMLVKVKREIIAFGVEAIDPAVHTSTRVDPAQLKQWLDDGQELVLLDVRNDYEVELGTFKSACAMGIDRFRDFPAAAQRLPKSMRMKRVITFCTGGIRCEKAAPYLESIGFDNVYQLDGGILKYLELCGGDHYDGECFVFDQRVAVDDTLSETDTSQCFACRSSLSLLDRAEPTYVAGKSCPHCFAPPAEQLEKRIASRMQQLQTIISPLPGSRPYLNRRRIHIKGADTGKRLIDVLAANYPFVQSNGWESRLAGGYLRRDGAALNADTIVSAGDIIEHLFPDTVEPDVNADLNLLHEDDALVVINKPAPLPMHPCGRFNRNTLIHIINVWYRPQKLRLAHRLDANTTGVVIFSRTRKVAGMVQPQFTSNGVQKVYLTRVAGRPAWTETVCDAPLSAYSLKSGARETVVEQGLPAKTRFKVIDYDADDEVATLEAHPLTGRTNQIRIHLWHLGHPIIGDPTYVAGRRITARQTLAVDDPPLNLHAWQISLTHPDTGQPVTYTAPPPNWFHAAGFQSAAAQRRRVNS